MSAPHIILDLLPSLCQKLSDLVEVWLSYNKNNFACFFETRCTQCDDCFGAAVAAIDVNVCRHSL